MMQTRCCGATVSRLKSVANSVNLVKGRHKINVRVAVGEQPGSELKVLLRKPGGSKAQFDIVGGK